MKLAFLCVCGVLALAVSHDNRTRSEVCPVMLRPGGPCDSKASDDCPYQLILPPLTIGLPKQLRTLEKTTKELQALKMAVEELRSNCLKCQQTDVGLQGDAAQGIVVAPSTTMQEMQVKMSRMSASLRHARSHINSLEGRLAELNLLNMRNVEAMMDGKVENITGVLNQLSNRCSSQCAVQTSPQFIIAPRDCSDYRGLGQRRSGVYQVTPDPRNGTFEVYCDMESHGGGWTLLQHRIDGSVSFNRTWAAYKRGFGDLRGEFWLGNDRIHLLSRARDMLLRIELEDFGGVREFATYQSFYVASEQLLYRLSVSGYSGTAGDALSFSRNYNHNHKFFSTPDRDNDKYPSGNCGAYYASGWWFDSCLSANLNGRYYHGKYKGVRNGIFWGTWHNISSEYYPTNYRQAFKTVKMMIRPKNFEP